MNIQIMLLSNSSTEATIYKFLDCSIVDYGDDHGGGFDANVIDKETSMQSELYAYHPSLDELQGQRRCINIRVPFQYAKAYLKLRRMYDIQIMPKELPLDHEGFTLVLDLNETLVFTGWTYVKSGYRPVVPESPDYVPIVKMGHEVQKREKI